MRRAHDGMAPAIGAEQAKLGRGARIHSLGVPAVTADMSGARLNVESGRTQCRRLGQWVVPVGAAGGGSGRSPGHGGC